MLTLSKATTNLKITNKCLKTPAKKVNQILKIRMRMRRREKRVKRRKLWLRQR
jgi:hypothetical protein